MTLSTNQLGGKQVQLSAAPVPPVGAKKGDPHNPRDLPQWLVLAGSQRVGEGHNCEGDSQLPP